MGLTWTTNVLEVISLASRAFALYYALQCAVAVITAARSPSVPRRALILVGGVLLGTLCVAITLFGLPAE